MNQVDIEALAVQLIDRMEQVGAAGAFDVEDPRALRDLLQREAQRRGLVVRTGTITADEHAVWVYTPKGDDPPLPRFD